MMRATFLSSWWRDLPWAGVHSAGAREQWSWYLAAWLSRRRRSRGGREEALAEETSGVNYWQRNKSNEGPSYGPFRSRSLSLSRSPLASSRGPPDDCCTVFCTFRADSAATVAERKKKRRRSQIRTSYFCWALPERLSPVTCGQWLTFASTVNSMLRQFDVSYVDPIQQLANCRRKRKPFS